MYIYIHIHLYKHIRHVLLANIYTDQGGKLVGRIAMHRRAVLLMLLLHAQILKSQLAHQYATQSNYRADV